jgi:hypothetical protein
MPDLAPDELEALEAYGYSPPEAPQAPVARLPNPVVPLAMRPVQRFTATSAPPVFDPMEQMREQINARQFKTAQEALDAALKFQKLRAFQHAIDKGEDPVKAFVQWGMEQPQAAQKLRELRLGAPPKIFQPPGLPPAYQFGGRLTFPPASALAKPPLSTNVTEHFLPGTTNVFARSVETGPQSRRVIEEKGQPLSARQRYYERKIDDIDVALRTLNAAEPPPPDFEKQRAALSEQKKEHQAALDALFKEPGKEKPTAAAPADAPRDAKERKAGTVYNTPRGPLKWTGTGWTQP